VLAAANLVPLAGVLFWDWSVFALPALFWMENVVVGALFALRLLCADPADAALWPAKLFMVPFFCLHYGMFTAVHGIFVFTLFGEGGYRVQGFALLAPALRALMARPYYRVVALHVAIILGGMAAAALGSPVWALAVLIAIKIALDLRAHVKEHSRWT
jgi:hypothetical protein